MMGWESGSLGRSAHQTWSALYLGGERAYWNHETRPASGSGTASKEGARVGRPTTLAAALRVHTATRQSTDRDRAWRVRVVLPRARSFCVLHVPECGALAARRRLRLSFQRRCRPVGYSQTVPAITTPRDKTAVRLSAYQITRRKRGSRVGVGVAFHAYQATAGTEREAHTDVTDSSSRRKPPGVDCARAVCLRRHR